MSVYDRLMKPLEIRVLAKMRRELIGYAYGDVLELGAKAGVNLKYYDLKQVAGLIASGRLLNPAIYEQAPPLVSFQRVLS